MNSVSGYRSLALRLACVVTIFSLVSIVLLPNTADAVRVGRNASGSAPNHSLDESGSSHDSDKAVNDDIPSRYKMVLRDEQSGVGIAYRVGSSVASGEAESLGPDEALAEEGISVSRGVDCLHLEGSCAACDTLRRKYANGAVNDVYSISAVQDKSGMAYVLPAEGAREVSVFQCVNGKLKIMNSGIFDGDVWFETTSHAPFGVYLSGEPVSKAQNSDDAQSASNSSYEAHTFNPDDESDTSSDNATLPVMIGVLIAVLVVAGIVLNPDKRQKR